MAVPFRKPKDLTLRSTNDRSDPPTVSVVMPVYNGEAHLAQALDSVLLQDFDDFEVVAVDDGSSDGSWEVLSRYAALDGRIKPHRSPRNQGHHAASNTAIERSTGRYVLRLDQDDLMCPHRMRRTVERFEAQPDVGLVVTAYARWLPDGRLLPRRPPAGDTGLRVAQMFGNNVAHSTLAIRREALSAEPWGAWYRDLPGPQDYDLICRLLRSTRAACIPEVLAVYRQETMAMTSQFGSRVEQAVAEISAAQLGAYLPETVIPAVRRVRALAAVPGDWRAVGSLHHVYRHMSRVDPLADAAELRRSRHNWTRQALRSSLSPSGRMPRDRRMVWALVRHDPIGAIGSLNRRSG